jgi:hypothetical protein
MSSNGSQIGTITATGMYPGVCTVALDIKGGAAGGGTYQVKPDGFPSVSALPWTAAN